MELFNKSCVLSDSMPMEGQTEFMASISSEANTAVRENASGKKYIEVLPHNMDAIDFSAAPNGRLPLLFNHDMTKRIGVVTNLALDPIEKKLTGKVKFGKSCPPDLLCDVQDGTWTELSFGYSTSNIEYKTVDKLPYGVAGKWKIFEVSLVTIAQDPTVGINKSLSVEELICEEEVMIEETKALNEVTEELIVNEVTVTPEVTPELETKELVTPVLETTETPIVEVESETKSITTQEIITMEPNENVTLPAKSVDFEGKVDFKKYSVGKLAMETLTGGRLTGLEAEVSQEMLSKGFSQNSIPTEILTKSFNFTDAGSGKESNVPSFGGVIDALIAESSMGKLGVLSLGLVNESSFPRLDAIDAPVVRADKAAATAAQTLTTSEVRFAPKELLAVQEMSFASLKFAPGAWDQVIINALRKKTLGKMDDLAFTNFLAEISNVQATTIADWANAAASAATLELQNAPGDFAVSANCKYAGKLKVFNKLKLVALAAAGVLPRPIFDGGMLQGVETVETPYMPMVSTFNPLIYGDWSNAGYSTFGHRPQRLPSRRAERRRASNSSSVTVRRDWFL